MTSAAGAVPPQTLENLGRPFRLCSGQALWGLVPHLRRTQRPGAGLNSGALRGPSVVWRTVWHISFRYWLPNQIFYRDPPLVAGFDSVAACLRLVGAETLAVFAFG